MLKLITITAALALAAPGGAAYAKMTKVAAEAKSTCKDGTTSTSAGSGTCSGHGGVAAAAPALTYKLDAKGMCHVNSGKTKGQMAKKEMCAAK